MRVSHIWLKMASKLRFSDIAAPGITRRMLRGHWAYFDVDGERITDPDEVARLNAIALPPAYSEAWFAADQRSHILATGIDARGRKQYRYHPDFREERDSEKFGRCAEFGLSLPALRKRVEQDLRKRKLTAERAVASVVKLLDCGHIRIGNESYARSNGSFGATTLRSRHVAVAQGRLKVRFRAKSGKLCTFSLRDRGLIRFVKQVQELPGQHLFQWLDDEGSAHPIGSTEVNDYIRATTKSEFTAKDFRTWAASVLAFEFLVENDNCTLRAMLSYVAQELGNTPAIARKSYVHPALIDLVKLGDPAQAIGRMPRKTKWLTRYERGLIAFLEEAG